MLGHSWKGSSASDGMVAVYRNWVNPVCIWKVGEMYNEPIARHRDLVRSVLRAMLCSGDPNQWLIDELGITDPILGPFCASVEVETIHFSG